MTPEQFVAVLVALAAVLAAVARCIAELRAYDRKVGVKLDSLLELTTTAGLPRSAPPAAVAPPPVDGGPDAHPATWSDKTDRGHN